MRELLPDLLSLLAARDARPVALARVIGVTGAAPRAPGAAMLVTGDGQIVGSVSGGCVESTLHHTAGQVLADGVAVVERFADQDALGLAGAGLTCGGEIEVFVEPVGPERLDDLHRLSTAVAHRQPVALATTLAAHPRWHVRTPTDQQPWLRLDHDVADLLATGRSSIIGVDDCDADDPASHYRPRTFVQSFAPPARLILVGANDFVRELAAIGSRLGFRVTVVDARPVFATRARFPEADEVVVGWPDNYLSAELEAGRLPASSAVCVMTHDAKFDVPALRVALSGAPLSFVGALGSRRTVADRRTRLLDAGVTPDQLARLRSPLGLDLGGHTPAEVAISIAAQLIAERNSGSARPLTHGRGPIHRHRG
ncbi:XdhC family protein [Gordonia sp. ABSL1-1]|uniref:XdhC family protein n=1 Tax=Gordonia sp. ABSL1-1 TaxID=3053923 RepID=UPI002572A867|nr:XdhC/CoxI family protein [Gordonia sp. ABSL1-1]MDL9938013.1 XdhC family protein [Gordonia sp. ABSL1-1]